MSSSTMTPIPDPPGRETTTILLSCLLTLLLTLWTAIHLNIPETPTTARILTRKFAWVLVGLTAPEILLWRAFEQWRDARAFLSTVAVTSGQRPRWWNFGTDDFGMEMSFFAVMGGFTICPLGCTNRRFTVTPRGLVRLLQERVITLDSLSARTRDIRDKAKVNPMVLVLVCSQGLWMVVQFIAEVTTGPRLTLLELHTVVHVACALGMYALWWNKPFDAYCSLDLDVDDAVAAVLCYSFSPRAMSRIHVSRTTPGAQRIEQPVESPGGGYPRMAEVPGVVRYGAYPARSEIGRMKGLDKAGHGVLAFRGQVLVNIEKGFYITCDSGISALDNPVREMQYYAVLAEAIRASPVDRSVLGDRLIAVDTTDYPLRAVESRPGLLCTEAGDLRSSSIAATDPVFASEVWVLSFLSLLYGGAHAAAWNSHFPTDVERLLWRVATVVVASPVFVFMVWEAGRYLGARIRASSLPMVVGIKAAVRYCGLVKERDGDDMTPPGRELVVMFVKLVVFQGVPVLAYVAARVFMVVESMISVRSLPGGTFDTPGWLKLWPHL